MLVIPMMTSPCYPECLDYGSFMLRAGAGFSALFTAVFVSLVWSLTLLVLRRRRNK